MVTRSPGWALISATISRKSCTEVPSIASMRSPARKPARAAGPSGITCPSTGGSGGVQNVNPSPRKSSAGSVRRRRCSASGTRSLAERSSPELARTARSASPRELVRRHGTLALVEQLHVAAERHRRHHVFDAIGAGDALEQRPAETDREAQHLEAEPPRDPEMPELVHRDENSHGDHEPQRVPDETHA